MHWYALSKTGIATLCASEADAKREVSSCDKLYPRDSPHIATQLVPLEMRITNSRKMQDYMEYSGNVVEIGDLDGQRGLRVEIRPQVFIEISGFSQNDIMTMPNFLYKKVKITIDAIIESEDSE